MITARGVLVVALLAATTHALGAQVALTRARGDAHDIRMTVVAEGVYQFTTVRDSYVRLLNSVAIVSDSDVLVFDTGTRPSAAREILARIRQLTTKPVRYIVNSHYHPDHWSGNGVYAAAFPNVEIIATSFANTNMHRLAPVWGPRFTTELEARRKALAEETRAGRRADGTALTADALRQDSLDLVDYASLTDETITNRRAFPTLTYDDSLVLMRGGREIHLVSMAGDADGTTVLWLPKERVLVTGDAVSYPMPYVGPHPRAQIETLRRLASLGASVIVPGHGPAFHDTLFVSQERQLFEAIVGGLDRLRAAGVTNLEEMQRRITADELRGAFTHGDADLETRYPARVRDIVALAFADTTMLARP